MEAVLRNQTNGLLDLHLHVLLPLDPPEPIVFFMSVIKAFPKICIDMKKLIPWESSCWNIYPEISVFFLIDFDKELHAGMNFTGYHPPPPRADPRATNFFRQNPRPWDSFSVQNSGPRVVKTKQKSPPPGITCLVRMPRDQ